MTLPTFPGGLPTTLKINLAERLEAVVGAEATFLGKVDANTTRILVKCEKIEFD
jgi:hypothetical protein